MRSYPRLPQIVEGLDYFKKNIRDKKRWRFVRKIWLQALEVLEFMHRSGYSHNAVSSESLWMSSTNQQDIDSVYLCLTDLGTSQKYTDLGPFAREAAMEDLYQLGLVFLELVFASFSEDNLGAQYARARLQGKSGVEMDMFTRAEDRDFSQLSQVQSLKFSHLSEFGMTETKATTVFDSLC